MTKIPNSLKISYYVECDQCENNVNIEGAVGTPADALKRMKDELADRGFEPLLLGKTAVGILCGKCCAEARGENNGDVESDDENETVTESTEPLNPTPLYATGQ